MHQKVDIHVVQTFCLLRRLSDNLYTIVAHFTNLRLLENKSEKEIVLQKRGEKRRGHTHFYPGSRRQL